MSSGQLENDVLAVARDDDQRARTDPFEHVAGLHRTDRDIVDGPVEIRARMERLAPDAFEDHGQRRVGQDRTVGQDAQQRDALVGQASLQNPAQVRLGIQVHLVDDRPGNFDAVGGEVRRVEHDFVDRPTDTALRDDDRGRPEHGGHRRVRQADHRPHPSVARPLDEQKLTVRPDRVSGRLDPGAQVVHDLALDVRLGEAPRNVHRTHHRHRVGQSEHGPHEHGVLVRRDTILDDGALADRLHEAGIEPAPSEQVEQAQAGRCLAPVLAGRGEVDLAH